MPKAPSLLTLKMSLDRERRKNQRLRLLIDRLGDEVRHNRRDLTLVFTRLAQLRAEVEALAKGRPS